MSASANPVPSPAPCRQHLIRRAKTIHIAQSSNRNFGTPELAQLLHTERDKAPQCTDAEVSSEGLSLIAEVAYQYCSQLTARTPTRRSCTPATNGSISISAWNRLTLSPARLRTHSFGPEQKTFSKRLRNHSKRRCCFVGLQLRRRAQVSFRLSPSCVPSRHSICTENSRHRRSRSVFVRRYRSLNVHSRTSIRAET